MPSTHTNMHLHIVFSTKNRLPLIEDDWQQELFGYLGGIARNQGGVCLAVGGMNDHVHLLVGIKPTHRLDYFMRELKASSSGWIRKNENPKFGWQKGYGAFAVSATNLKKVERYILNQETHHKNKNFKEEYVWLLQNGNIEFDEKYLW
ncbi:MAG: IS200/IS605 family transposase [Pyrinomonadaceae bacterium]|nr:IS200/IS605 family transposase [Pyrinomonadaceae bacterium]